MLVSSSANVDGVRTSRIDASNDAGVRTSRNAGRDTSHSDDNGDGAMAGSGPASQHHRLRRQRQAAAPASAGSLARLARRPPNTAPYSELWSIDACLPPVAFFSQGFLFFWLRFWLRLPRMLKRNAQGGIKFRRNWVSGAQHEWLFNVQRRDFKRECARFTNYGITVTGITVTVQLIVPTTASRIESNALSP